MADPLGLINTHAHGVSPTRPRPPTAPDAPHGPDAGDGPDFKDVLMKNIEQVNQLQQDAETAIEDLATGKRSDIAAVATAKQKADLAFQALLQVRNKLMDAYDEVKQIRV